MGKATKAKIVKELKRIEEDTTLSSKSHFDAADRWNQWHLRLGIPATVLSAIAGVSALSQFDYHNVIAGIIAILVAILTGLITFLNPSERAERYLNAGNAYNELKNNARIAHDVEVDTLDVSELSVRMKELNDRRSELNQESPQPSRSDFVKARKGIEEGESVYVADK